MRQGLYICGVRETPETAAEVAIFGGLLTVTPVYRVSYGKVSDLPLSPTIPG